MGAAWVVEAKIVQLLNAVRQATRNDLSASYAAGSKLASQNPTEVENNYRY